MFQSEREIEWTIVVGNLNLLLLFYLYLRRRLLRSIVDKIDQRPPPPPPIRTVWPSMWQAIAKDFLGTFGNGQCNQSSRKVRSKNKGDSY